MVLTAGIDRKVIAWEADTGKKLLDLTGHLGRIFAKAVSPDGNRIATAGADGWVELWMQKRDERSLLSVGFCL
jgi:WD40 repeat protein